MSDRIKIDGVIDSADKKVLIKYPEEDQEKTFYVPDFVEELGESCFENIQYAKDIYIGKNVKKVGRCALGNAFNFKIKQVYIPSTVTEFAGEIFDRGVDDGGDYYPIEIVGGEKGSAIEKYCNERGIPFVVFEPTKVEDFYSLSVKELKALAKRQAEEESDWLIQESESGYQVHFLDGVLTITALGNSAQKVVIKPTRILLNTFRRKMVKRIIIGNGITGLADWTFDDYENLDEVYIGADVCKIAPKAFCGRENGNSWGCKNLSAFVVDENNKWYKSVDGVLFTYDMQTLVRYAPAKADLAYQVEACVREIGELAFMRTKNLQCLYLGKDCVSIGELAFLNAFSLKHVYFANGAIRWSEEQFPFIEMMGYDRPYRLGVIFGGANGSEVQQVCVGEGEYFHVIEENEIEDFLAVPVPEKEEDKYMQDCLKMMIVFKDGTLEQVGEFGDELILPEGVVRTRYRINLSKCKKVSIPSTMETIWLEGFDGPAPDLKEFVVSPQNKEFYERDGHLYYTPLHLIMYAPGGNNYGVIPEGTEAIREGAFRLIPVPMKKLYLPGSLSYIQPQCVRGGWFYEAEISPDNIDYKAIDGSIYTIDGKELVRAKISKNGFVVPDGTERIAEGALYDVSGSVTIPASVKKIEDVSGFGRNVKKMITPKGSYAAWHVMNYKRMFPIEIVYDGETEPYDPNEQEEKEKRPLPDFSDGFLF